jgi:hypothetical protein
MHRKTTQYIADCSQNPAYMLMSIRHLCKLRRRDVAAATRQIAEMLGPEFAIPEGGLADIEQGRVTPTICTLSSLCAVYGMEMRQMLGWYRLTESEVAA